MSLNIKWSITPTYSSSKTDQIKKQLRIFQRKISGDSNLSSPPTPQIGFGDSSASTADSSTTEKSRSSAGKTVFNFSHVAVPKVFLLNFY